MNDFTKDDLIEISKIFKAYLDGYEAKHPIFIRLQCMIDNYCAHDNLGIFDPFYCLDCKKDVR